MTKVYCAAFDKEDDSSANENKNSLNEEEFVELVSAEGTRFKVAKPLIMKSGTLKKMLSTLGQFSESKTNVIELKEIKENVLEIICEYLQYNYKYNSNQVDINDPKLEIPDFVVPPEIALDVMMASDFLDV